MAKKKVKRRSAKKSVGISSSRNVSKNVTNLNVKKVKASRRKLGLVVKNLILFLIFTIILLLLSSYTKHEGLKYAFDTFAKITGLVSLAFLFVLLVLLLMRA